MIAIPLVDPSTIEGDPLYKPLVIERYDLTDDEGVNHYAYRADNLQLVPIVYKDKAGRRRTKRSLAASIQPVDYPKPDHDRTRLVVAFGCGVDSFAMLVALKTRGIRPDLIHFADTGSEHEHTLKAFNYAQAWCKDNDFPPIVIVRRHCPVAGHRGLIDQGWNTRQLPSAAFHQNHSCSVSWKLEPQRAYDKQLPWLWEHEDKCTTAIGFDADELPNRRGVREAIGFDADELGSRKSGSRATGSYAVTIPGSGNEQYTTWFPLAEYGLDREACVNLIRSAGMPIPGKSSCTMCPFKKACEIHATKDESQAAIALEKRFLKANESRATKSGKKIKGLNSNRPWSTIVNEPYVESDKPGLKPDKILVQLEPSDTLSCHSVDNDPA